MAILFYSLIFILTKFLFVSSITLDIHYPENFITEQYHEQFHPCTSIQSYHPNEFQCACQPCQCPYPYSPGRDYYSSPVFRSSPTPTQPPVIIPPSPPIFSPRASFTPVQLTPNIQTTRDETKYKSEDFGSSHTQTQQFPNQLTPNVQTTQDETKYKSVDYAQSHTQTQQFPNQLTPNVQTTQDETKYKSIDYAQSHTQTQQIPGLTMRRSLQHPYYAIVQSPINSQGPQQQNIYRYIRTVLPSNSPAHQVYNDHNSPTTDSNRGAGSISLRGSVFRSVMESSKTQNGNVVATQSPIIIPEYSSNSPINFDNSRNERGVQMSPLIWGRGITKNNYTIYNYLKNTTASIHEKSPKIISNSTQYNIVEPLRKLVTSSSVSNSSNSFLAADKNQSINFNSNRGVTGPFNDTRVLIGSARSSEYGRRIYYPTVSPVYRAYIRPQRPLANLLPTTSAVSAVYPGQSSATFVQRPILNSVGKVGRSIYNPYRFSTSIQSAE